MSTVGQPERATQNRVVKLFQSSALDYHYYGDWQDRADNSNIEEGYLRAWLTKQAVDEGLIKKAIRQLKQAAIMGEGKKLYHANKKVYGLLRYGVKVRDQSETTKTVWLIDWENPNNNDFAIAEEVSVKGKNTKRPDIVIYVNGIALGVIELKRASVSVTEGIRQNLDNQKKTFIRDFFSTMQLVMAGSDSEGLRYGTIETTERHYYRWKEENTQYNPVLNKPGQEVSKKHLSVDDVDYADNPLDFEIINLCRKDRFLEIIHDFIVFDAGTKKTCRQNQYYGVKAAQQRLLSNEGGIIWHTQGSGKSLTMVWLAKWLREHVDNARVLVVTDRTELDEQIEGVFKGVDEDIYRSKSGMDLIANLNAAEPWLLCALVHKFGHQSSDREKDQAMEDYLKALLNNLPKDFKAKGKLFIFVDECHRTQSGQLHAAMKTILPEALFVGYTGTPLLKKDKQKSIEVFGTFIHTYKFDEAVADGVVLDLQYEARDIDQFITSQDKVDTWFDAKTRGLSDMAKVQLKQKWGTMQKVLSSQSRLEQIVQDILLDMDTKPRLMDGRGNAMLVCASIYQACKVYELFSKTELKGKCAIVTSYLPSPADIKGEEAGEGLTEKLHQYDIYQDMLADYFEIPKEDAIKKAEEFEKKVKDRFKKEPGQMRLLIVVDKLLTGFDAPSATYLYIDKKMQDHGLFQAICRVNRLDGDDKEYGYIVDYKDLFHRLESSIGDYTSGAFDAYEKEDVDGLLTDRLTKGKERLEQALETVKAICEPVLQPKDQLDYLRYFCGDVANKDDLRLNEPKRVALYKNTAALLRAYANLANEMQAAGYTVEEAQAIKGEVTHFSEMRKEVKLASGDEVDMKQYEPAMRQLLDAYIKADDSEKVSDFDNMSLVELIVEKVKQNPPESTKKRDREAMAETIENNIRKVIIDEQPINPKYYEKMSELLDALIEQRREEAISYQEYLKKVKDLAEGMTETEAPKAYPESVDTRAKQALYDNLGENEALVIRIDTAVFSHKKALWKGNHFKEKRVENAIKAALDGEAVDFNVLMTLIKNQPDYD